MAIIKIKNAAIDLDAAEIPNIDASKITSGTISSSRISGLPASSISSGTFSDARIAASNVSQHASTFDDNKIVNDISTLALRQATNENAVAYNTNSQFVDVFQDSSGVSALTNCARSENEFISSVVVSNAYNTASDLKSSYTESKNITYGGTDIRNWFNGNFSADTSNGWYFNHSTGSNAGKYVQYVYSSGQAVSGFKFYCSVAPSEGIWQFSMSNDGSNFTNFGDPFTWGGTAQGSSPYTPATTVEFDNTTSYTHYKFSAVSGNFSSSAYNTELVWRIGTNVSNATGNFISNAITASSSTNKMGAIITYQDQAGTNALNSDIVLQLSADNGSNFTTATLTALPDFSTGIKMAKVNDLAVTAGTSLKYKVSFANQASGSKEARIRGVSLQY